MSLFETILADIADRGKSLSAALGDDTKNLNDVVQSGPFDGDQPVPEEAWHLAQGIVTDCYQLTSILTPTRIQAMKLAFSAGLETAIGIAAHFKIADVIEERGGKATVQELADTVGTDASKLANILQALSSRHTFVESVPGVFSNNRHSRSLQKGHGGAGMIESYALVSGKAFDSLLDLMTDEENMHSIAANKSAFSRAWGVPMGIAEWIIQPGNEVYLEQLMTGMPWLTETSARGSVDQFDWDKIGAGRTICDMGCSDGGIMARVKSKVPSSHIILQDLAPVLPLTRQVMEAFHPEALKKGEIQVMEHDYFTPQKTAADIYWMRGVLHDYTDEESIQILNQLAPQLQKNPEARLLVNEIVKTSLYVPPGQENEPASKLVPEKQSEFLEMTSLMQLHTTAFLAGLERSFTDFEQLFKKAGYRLLLGTIWKEHTVKLPMMKSERL
ncbi:S-adenosyl-L-methionine-dependent methyltransferase [Dactylonectria macrodidyma]|uniref:S-adenosyl-L-methionine-dependent methyltransferase n=1 Tax=Dactylonectria macrodidyma TaxID=307937 RepID=A0A9P9JFA7_9HYPO|nr:S-adenosyl-L-methionine-dependent methyltransferase [Dactylonectria macrodidyma]